MSDNGSYITVLLGKWDLLASQISQDNENGKLGWYKFSPLLLSKSSLSLLSLVTDAASSCFQLYCCTVLVQNTLVAQTKC